MQSLCVEFITLLWRMEKKKLFKVIPELLKRQLLVKLLARILEFRFQRNTFKSYEENSSGSVFLYLLVWFFTCFNIIQTTHQTWDENTWLSEAIFVWISAATSRKFWKLKAIYIFHTKNRIVEWFRLEGTLKIMLLHISLKRFKWL